MARATLKVRLRDRQMGKQFRVKNQETYLKVQRAMAQTAKTAAAEIKQRGDADITGAGRFGSRWTRGFHSVVSVVGSNFSVRTYHDIFYFSVFEFGKTIRGKPLLWIPLSFATDAQGVMARDFRGGLFRVDRKRGAPLLLSRRTGEPKYFGREQVRIPRKFHIRDICKDVASRLKTIYQRSFRG